LLENSNVLIIYFLIGTFSSDVNRLTSYAGLVYVLFSPLFTPLPFAFPPSPSFSPCGLSPPHVQAHELTPYPQCSNGIGSIGTVVAFVLGAVDVNLKGPLWANFACFLAAAPGLVYVAWHVTEPVEAPYPSSPNASLTPVGSAQGDEEKGRIGAVLPQLTT
jgi:hypothetical protein